MANLSGISPRWHKPAIGFRPKGALENSQGRSPPLEPVAI